MAKKKVIEGILVLQERNCPEQDPNLYSFHPDSKESACNVRELGLSLGWEDPLEKGIAAHSAVFWPGEFHGQRSLVGYSFMGSQRIGHDSVTFTFSPRVTSPVHVVWGS